MATLTVVITYTGTLGLNTEVQSYTSAGTAFASLSAAELYSTRKLLNQAGHTTSAVYGKLMSPG
jgi:hypothetical protein